MDDSLSTLQKLYEAGYVTYPRTNSEYLATAEQGKMKSIIASVAKIGYPVSFRFAKSIFDDSKIESHSALTPTYKIPNPKDLTEKEKQVYSTVLRRFVAVFCSEECLAEKSELRIPVWRVEVPMQTEMEQLLYSFDEGYCAENVLLPVEDGELVIGMGKTSAAVVRWKGKA